MAETITLNELVEELCTTLLRECKTHIKFRKLDVKEIIEESKQVPHKAVCTTSFGDGESDDEDTDWRERYESTREAPYGCLTEEDMKQAIKEGNLDIIEDSPVLANITLGNMLREDPDLEASLDDFIRSHKNESVPSQDEIEYWQQRVCDAPSEEDAREIKAVFGTNDGWNDIDEAEEIQDTLDWWSDMPETELNIDALMMIEEQRSLSPKRQTWQDQRKIRKALLEIF